jgi:four helix bundle protein
MEECEDRRSLDMCRKCQLGSALRNFAGISLRHDRCNAPNMDRAQVRELEGRTRNLALDAIRLHRALRPHPELWDIASQLSRAANSVAANHRAMGRGRSTREFAAKLHTVHEEADETVHWLDVLSRCALDPEVLSQVANLRADAITLRNYFGHARATTRRRYFTPP